MRQRTDFLKPVLGTLCLALTTLGAQAQWLDWDIQTDTRLTLSSVANADDEEKDLWAADLNQDGWTDVVVVRKEPFSAASEPPKADLLLINQQGVLVDMTAEFAPEFISNPSFARDVYVSDVDGDTWEDVIIVNTFSQQPMLYMNMGNDADGNWLRLTDESATRLPTLTSNDPLICAVWADDLTGNGAPDLYFVNYRFNSTGGTAQDFLLINNGTGHFTDEGDARAGNLLNSAFGTAGQIHDMDGDGINDFWLPSALGVTEYHMDVYNRWGAVLWTSDDPERPWMGEVDGGAHYVPDGLYMWRVHYRDQIGFRHAETGTVQIIR